MKRTESRATRNNNPLNIIRSNNHWKGLADVQNDLTFCTFVSPEYGFRAALKIMNTYVTKHNIFTVRQLVFRWCPDDTAESYADYVINHLLAAGTFYSAIPVDAFSKSKLTHSKSVYCFVENLLTFMALYEGYNITSKSFDEIKKAIDLL